ncbi:hypothetical protein PVAP13_8KG131741 [Panicum virgatum]|nr:hypothetical protein PVAP13_8KG131741 [Panicum virgatum]
MWLLLEQTNTITVKERTGLSEQLQARNEIQSTGACGSALLWFEMCWHHERWCPSSLSRVSSGSSLRLMIARSLGVSTSSARKHRIEMFRVERSLRVPHVGHTEYELIEI